MRFLRHVQKLRIQLYLQNATCYAMPPVSAKRESRTRANRSDLYQHSLLSFDWSHTDIVNVTERNVFLQADSQEVSECEGWCVSLKGFPLLHSFFRSPKFFSIFTLRKIDSQWSVSYLQKLRFQRISKLKRHANSAWDTLAQGWFDVLCWQVMCSIIVLYRLLHAPRI